MTRKEKYQFLRSLGLSSEQARIWRDRKIEKIETLDKDIILRNNKELKKEYNNHTTRMRYNFLREIGLSPDSARKLRNDKRINVENLSIRNNKVVKNDYFYKLQEKVKENPKLYTLSIENDVNKYIKKYKNIENYGVYTKWGTLTRVEPYKHHTYQLVNRIREVFNANEKQGFYILYLMYQNGLTIDQIQEIIKTDPLFEQYAKERTKKK